MVQGAQNQDKKTIVQRELPAQLVDAVNAYCAGETEPDRFENFVALCNALNMKARLGGS